MKTRKYLLNNEQNRKEIEHLISSFSQHFMSNSKWIKLLDTISEHKNIIRKILFKEIRNNNIGELYLPISYFDHEEGIEGRNSFEKSYSFREIEYLIFPKSISSDISQDLEKISIIIKSVGEFYLEQDENELKLICYKI